MGQDVRLVGNLMQQRNCMFVVVREPVSELLEGCSNQSRADVLGQIERLTEVHENASREFGNAVQHELGCQGNSGGAVAMIGLAGFTLLGRDRAGTRRDVQHRKVGQLRTQGRDEEQVDAANSAAACGLLVVVRWSGPVVIVFEKFCNSAFDFENANLSKKKLRHKIEQQMTEFAKFVENSNTPGNFRILTDFLTEPGKEKT